MVVENSNSTQVRQQCLGCDYTKFELIIPNFFGYVLNFPRVSFFGQFYHRNDSERNETFTEMCDALWKKYQSIRNLAYCERKHYCYYAENIVEKSSFNKML